MKTTQFLIATLVLANTLTAMANTETIQKENSFGPPIKISAEGSALIFASNVLTDDCDQEPVFPEPGKLPALPELKCDNSYPHLKGDVSINGVAADELFKGMRDVKLHPGVPNILERERNSLGWGEVPYKTGKNIFCYQYPVKDSGTAHLETTCLIEITDLNTGEISTNKQNN